MDINISQCNKETMINGFAARKHDVATLKEALQIAKDAGQIQETDSNRLFSEDLY